MVPNLLRFNLLKVTTKKKKQKKKKKLNIYSNSWCYVLEYNSSRTPMNHCSWHSCLYNIQLWIHKWENRCDLSSVIGCPFLNSFLLLLCHYTCSWYVHAYSLHLDFFALVFSSNLFAHSLHLVTSLNIIKCWIRSHAVKNTGILLI